MDCHIHVDEIVVRDSIAAKNLGAEVGRVRWSGVSTDRHVKHVEKDRLDTIFAIYENPESVSMLRKAVPDCNVEAMFFVRSPSNVKEELLIDLYERKLLDAIKIHPVVDNFELKSKNLETVLRVARRFRLPVLYHADDRRNSMHLTSPELQGCLVDENPDVLFIIGHGGAYAHPRLCGNNPQTKSYWDGPYSRKTLIGKALTLAACRDNVYYDLSVATNVIKASLIAEFLNRYPAAAEKILIGTDFPIKFASAQSQLAFLERAGLRKTLVEKIASNRLTR